MQQIPWSETTIRVRYAETDQMKVAHHAAYFVWFELARSVICRERGIDYGALEEAGLFLPIVEARCRYRSPARYDDEITIRAHVQELKRSTMRIAYVVKRNDTVIAEGETLQALVAKDGRPRAFPAYIANRLKSTI